MFKLISMIWKKALRQPENFNKRFSKINDTEPGTSKKELILTNGIMGLD